MRSNQESDFRAVLAKQDRELQALEDRFSKINNVSSENAEKLRRLKEDIQRIEAQIIPISHSTRGDTQEKNARILSLAEQRNAFIQQYKASVETEERRDALERKKEAQEKRKADLISLSQLFKKFNDLKNESYSSSEETNKIMGFNLAEDNQTDIINQAVRAIEGIKIDLQQLSNDHEFLQKLFDGSLSSTAEFPPDVNLGIVPSALTTLQEKVNILHLEKERFEAIRQLEAQKAEFDALAKELGEFQNESKMILESMHSSLKEPVSKNLAAIDSIVNEHQNILNLIKLREKEKVLDPARGYTLAIRAVALAKNPEEVQKNMENFAKLQADLMAIKYEMVNLKTFQEQSVLLQQKEFYAQLKTIITAHIPQWDKEHTVSGTSVLFNGKSHKVPQGIGEILKILDPKFEKQSFRFFKKKVIPKKEDVARQDIQNLLKFKEIADRRLNKGKSKDSRDPNSLNTQVLTLLSEIDINKLNDPIALKALNEKLLKISPTPKETPQLAPPKPTAFL